MSRDKITSEAEIWSIFEHVRRTFFQERGEQKSVAERLGVDRRKVNKWLKGRPKLPSLWHLADGLRFSIDKTVGHVTQDVEVLYTVRDMAFAIFSALDRVLPERPASSMESEKRSPDRSEDSRLAEQIAPKKGKRRSSRSQAARRS